MKFAEYSVQAIGVIESCFPDKFGTPRQPGLVPNSLARIKFRGDVQPELALQGLENFSHVWLIFWFHLNNSARYHAKVHPPRLKGESMGLFATRSPHRPNPIGLSLVEVDRVEKDSLVVRGVDLVSGTPILDIKPYMPSIEAKAEAKEGWASELEAPNLSVTWSEEARQKLQSWNQISKFAFVRETSMELLAQLVEQTIGLDPRPVVYRGYEAGESPYRSEHAVRIYDGDFHFQFLDATKVVVLRVEIIGS